MAHLKRQLWRKLRKRFAIGGAVVLTGVALFLAMTAGVHTEAFDDAEGNFLPGSVAVMARVRINDIHQSMWFRGISTNNPALILLHGGPGASESALFRHYNSELEQNFLVVYWEQRGAGRSFHPGIPPETMTIEETVKLCWGKANTDSAGT